MDSDASHSNHVFFYLLNYSFLLKKELILKTQLNSQEIFIKTQQEIINNLIKENADLKEDWNEQKIKVHQLDAVYNN